MAPAGTKSVRMNVDAVLQAARERSLVVSMTLYHQRYRKHITLAEGAYESGSEYGFNVTPPWIRRQACYSFLAGAHHTHGHKS